MTVAARLSYAHPSSTSSRTPLDIIATNDLLSHQEYCSPLVLVLAALDEILFGPPRAAILDFLTQLTASNPQSIRLLPQVGEILISKSALWAEQVGNLKESSHLL